MQERWTSLSMVVAMTMFAAAGCAAEDVPAPPDLTNADVTHYRIAEIDLPNATAEIRALGLDIDGDLEDGDPGVDNHLGNIHIAISTLDSDFTVEATTREGLELDVVWMLSLYDAGADGAGAAIDTGIVVDGVALPALAIEPAIGADRSAVLTGERAVLPLGLLSDPRRIGEPTFVEVLAPSIMIERVERDRAQVLFAGAFAEAEVDRIIYPRLAAYYTAQLADDRSPFAEEYLDLDGDRVITVDECRDNDLIQSLLFPDVWLDGQNAVSFGMRLVATTP